MSFFVLLTFMTTAPRLLGARHTAMMVPGCRYWFLALQWFVWSENPITAGRKTWMYEALCVTGAHLAVLFFAAVTGLGSGSVLYGKT